MQIDVDLGNFEIQKKKILKNSKEPDAEHSGFVDFYMVPFNWKTIISSKWCGFVEFVNMKIKVQKVKVTYTKHYGFEDYLYVLISGFF